MRDWRPFFPLEKPRPQQVEALDKICSLIDSGKRRIIAELPTGVGKSPLAVALGRWLAASETPDEEIAAGTVILTSQRSLQDQYMRDFDDMKDLRSGAHFQCTGPMGGTCAETSRVRKSVGKENAAKYGLVCGFCPYRAAKDAFKEARLGVTNYSYFLSEGAYAGELPRRQLLVLDEAHNVEDEVRRWSSVSVDEEEAKEYGLELPFNVMHRSALRWLSDNFRDAVRKKLEQVGAKLHHVVALGKFKEAVSSRLASENDRLDKRICQLNRLFEKGGELLVSYEDGKKKALKVQPTEAAGMAQELLYSKGTAILAMTATVLDDRIFRRSTGLDDSEFVSVPSPFKPSAFGVKLRFVGKMSRGPNNIDKSLPLIPRAIKKILADNPDSKGIIHTVNYNIARKVSEVNNPRLLIQTGAKDREEMLREHMRSSRPTVLVSPGMTEGLDLKDDLGRFQVICKVPYPDFSDPVVQVKMKSDGEWYNWRAIRTLVQACGRSVRSESDWTRTYILDECLLLLLDRSGHMFPKTITAEMEPEEPF